MTEVSAAWRAWRSSVRAELAAARAELMWQLVGLDEEILSGTSIVGRWTAKDILAHVAAWDDLYRQRIELALASRDREIVPLDPDWLNARLYDEWQGRSIDEALTAATTARKSFLDTLAYVPDDVLDRTFPLPWSDRSVAHWTEWRAQRDREHAAQVATWRDQKHPYSTPGPRTILNAALRAARKELLTAVALIPAEERSGFDIEGETLEDALRLRANDEEAILTILARECAGRPPDESWNQVWHSVHRIHDQLLREVDMVDGKRLSADGGSLYRCLAISGKHDRALAERLRDALR